MDSMHKVSALGLCMILLKLPCWGKRGRQSRRARFLVGSSPLRVAGHRLVAGSVLAMTYTDQTGMSAGIIVAWIVTLPASGIVAWLFYHLVILF